MSRRWPPLPRPHRRGQLGPQRSAQLGTGRSDIADRVMGMKPGRTVGRADDGHRTAVIGMTGVDRLGDVSGGIGHVGTMQQHGPVHALSPHLVAQPGLFAGAADGAAPIPCGPSRAQFRDATASSPATALARDDPAPATTLSRDDPHLRRPRQLGLVEQEGVGVDMMVGDLIRIGGEQPLIESTDSPAVRVVLGGRPVDINRYRFFSSLEPAEAREDTDAALLVWRATNLATPFLTAKSCHRLLQRTQTDAQNALLRVSTYRTAGGVRLLTPIAIPEAGPVAWRLSQPARRHLRIPQPGLAAATEWVRERRRISTAEYRALTGVSNPTAVAHLKTLAQEEGLVPSRPSGRGPGFHYRFPQDG